MPEVTVHHLPAFSGLSRGKSRGVRGEKIGKLLRSAVQTLKQPSYISQKSFRLPGHSILVEDALPDFFHHSRQKAGFGREVIVYAAHRNPGGSGEITYTKRLEALFSRQPIELHEGRIAGAGLDVYESEPEPPRELLSFNQVVRDMQRDGHLHAGATAMAA